MVIGLQAKDTICTLPPELASLMRLTAKEDSCIDRRSGGTRIHSDWWWRKGQYVAEYVPACSRDRVSVGPES